MPGAAGAWNGTTFAAYSGMIQLPATFNLGSPVMLATLDTNGAGDIGATVLHLQRVSPNRASFSCNNTATAVHWFAIDQGVHAFGTLHVEAHSVVPSSAPSGTINFTPGTFTTPPLVFLTLEGNTATPTATFSRVISNTTTGGFTYSFDAGPSVGQVLHWVAMDRGTYLHGRFKWTADSMPGSCTTGCAPYNLTLGTSPNVLLTLHDLDGSSLPTFVRLLNVTPTQLTYRIGGSVTDRVNYLAVEDLPEVLSLP